MLKAVADAVDQLLDGEQRHQGAGKRDRRRERSDRRSGRQPETAEAAQVIDIAEPDQAKRDREHDEANEDLDREPRPAVQGLRDRRQIEMIVAPGGDRGADEDRIDEQRRGHLLKPQPWMAYGAGDDV